MNATESLVNKLLDRIYTTHTLKAVSETLEELTQNRAFKTHAADITNDDSLTSHQKVTQLLYLTKTIDIPLLFEFFSDILDESTIWVFQSGKIDYFDRFVQEFQMATEHIGVVYLTTAINLKARDIRSITADLSKDFGYKVILKHEVNQAIIGGAQVRVENLIFDFSLRTKFQQFQQKWLGSIKTTDTRLGRHESD